MPPHAPVEMRAYFLTCTLGARLAASMEALQNPETVSRLRGLRISEGLRFGTNEIVGKMDRGFEVSDTIEGCRPCAGRLEANTPCVEQVGLNAD